MGDGFDQKYYQSVRPGSLAERVLIKARAEMFADFMDHMMPSASDRVLDVGVSDVINDGANVLEREYPYQEQITACGLSEALEFRREFPKCRYFRIQPNMPLPFSDGSFEIATANAVLEHVGSFRNQVSFVSELSRVARKVFITVPNRYFPIEHHTSLIFVHYSDLMFKAACRVFEKGEWSSELDLILMTRTRLKDLASTTGRRIATGYTGLRLGPISSNLFLTLTDPSSSC